MREAFCLYAQYCKVVDMGLHNDDLGGTTNAPRPVVTTQNVDWSYRLLHTKCAEVCCTSWQFFHTDESCKLKLVIWLEAQL